MDVVYAGFAGAKTGGPYAYLNDMSWEFATGRLALKLFATN